MGQASFKSLVIIFDTNLHVFNVNLKFKTIKKIRHWKHRNLTPFDCLTKLKFILLPTLNNIVASLPNPSYSQLKDLYCEFYTFLTGGNHIRLKRGMYTKEFKDRCLKIISIKFHYVINCF